MIFTLILLHCYKKYFQNTITSNKFTEGFQENFKEGLKFPKISDISKSILGPLQPMIDFFKQLPKKLKSLDKGFRDIFFGIGDEFKYLGIGTARGFEDIGLLIAYASQFVFSYTMCGVKYISNIPNCILYYTVDAFLSILYLPIRISLWILYLLGINLYPTQNKLWKYVEKINGYIYGAFGFNVIRWPKNIRDECYNCKRLKTSVLLKKAKDIDYDFKVNIPKILMKGVDRIKRGGNEIFGVAKDVGNSAGKAITKTGNNVANTKLAKSISKTGKKIGDKLSIDKSNSNTNAGASTVATAYCVTHPGAYGCYDILTS
jgi:hypothetical protein